MSGYRETKRKSIKRLLTAGLGALLLAAGALPPAVASAAPVEGRTADIAAAKARGALSAMASACQGGWRRLRYGDTGQHGVVEPGAPYHVRLAKDTNGRQNFQLCNHGFASTGDRMISFRANGNWPAHLRNGSGAMVSATGSNENEGLDSFWYVCALDAQWAEIRWLPDKNNGAYMTRIDGYLKTRGGKAGGDVLWQISEFADLPLPFC